MGEIRQRKELCGQGLHFRNSTCISDSEEKSRLLFRLAASPREDKLTQPGCPEKRPHKGISIACCISWKQCRDASHFFLSPPPPALSSLNWVSTKSCWSSRIFWGEGDLPEWEQLIINGSEGQGSEVSPTCFSSLCSFIRFYFILTILTISLLKREQRFLLSHQATQNCMNLWLIPGKSSVVWWLCNFHGWRLFRQKKSKCKILAISIAIEREILLRCFVRYYFLISLLFCITLYFLSLKKFFLCEILHVSLCLHHAESPGKTPQKRCCLHLGVSIWAGFCWKD